MLLRSFLLLGNAAMGQPPSFRDLGVGPSTLEERSDSVHFPTVSGANLLRDEVEFPAGFAGELNIVFVPFLREQQAVVDTWVPFAQQMEALYDHVAYYELPTIQAMPLISRTFINEGMRAGIPDPATRERTVTLYVDLIRFMRATGIDNRNQVHTLLVDREGTIFWRTTGRYTAYKGNGLRAAINEHTAAIEAS